MRNNIFSKALFVLTIVTLLAPGLTVTAQRRGAVASSKPAAAPKCSGGWTGLVTYKRTQSQTDSKRVERVSGRGHDTRNWEMKYEYNARVTVVETPEKNGSS